MSDNDNIFNAEPTSQPVADAPSITLPDEVKDLVGEGKKYESPEAALRALAFSQTHISTIEQENRTLREQLDSAKKVEDVLAKLDQKVDSTIVEPVQEANPVDIDKLLDAKLTQREKQLVQTNNMNSVNSKMVEMFGEKAQDHMLSKANELGMTVDQMKATAENSPNAFLAWFGTPEPITQQTIQSDVNTTNFQPSNQVKVDTYAYFEKMRKENPTQYYDSKTQFRMTQLASNPGFMG